MLNIFAYCIFIFSEILKELIAKCQEGVKVLELCEFGDNRLNEETSKVFKKDKEMKKGILFFYFVFKNYMLDA
jgi:methionine aminopeptidase